MLIGSTFAARTTRVRDQAEPHPVTKLAAIKRRFTFKVRHFDEAVEEEKCSSYCKKRIAAGYADPIIKVFREMRKELAPHRGEERTTAYAHSNRPSVGRMRRLVLPTA